MFALVLGILRTRSAQAVTILILAALATAAAAASPWYAFASAHKAATAAVDAAPAAQRLLSVRRTTGTAGDPRTALTNFQTAVAPLLPVPAAGTVLGMTHALSTDGATTRSMPVAYRDGSCEHLRITGSCPDAPGEAVLSRYSAQLLGVSTGGDLTLRESPTSPPLVLHVTGLYDVDDPSGVYWADPLFGQLGATFGGDQSQLDPSFVTIETFRQSMLREATFAYDVPLPKSMVRGDGGYDLAPVLRQTQYQLSGDGFFLVVPGQDLLRTIAADRQWIADGVLVSSVQVIVLCWLALGFAGWYTARQRRHDVALLKLRGTSRTRVIRLALGQHLLPMSLGFVVGAAVGYGAARLLAGPVTDPDQQRLAALLSVSAAMAALLGGLVVLTVTELAALRAPVSALLRRAGSRQRGWRSDVFDLLLVAIAVAFVYQAHANDSRTGLTLAAPALVALAVALLLARLLGHLARRGGAAALRAGRLGWGLGGVRIARQPGLDRLFTLVTVAVAGLATAASGWSVGQSAQAQRSDAELGAARVLTVQATSRTALLHAVRQADPGGREAMAVVVNLIAQPPVLAVDASRLSAVAQWRDDYGPLPSLTVQAPPGRDSLAPLPAVTGDSLTLHARNEGGDPVDVVAQLENQESGVAVAVRFAALAPGEHDVSAPVAGCGGGSGCRLVRLELWAPSTPDAPSDRFESPNPGTSVAISGLTQSGPPLSILDKTSAGDSRRWRANTDGIAMTVRAADGVLGLTVAQPPEDFFVQPPPPDNQVFVVDTPSPLPIVLAGARPPAWVLNDATMNPFGLGVPAATNSTTTAGDGGTIPVRVTATAPVLPVLGRTGIMIDLAAAQRMVANAGTAGTYQVWLAAGASSAVVDRLKAAGLTVLGEDSPRARGDRLDDQGPAVASFFALLAGGIGLLLAAAAVAVASTVDGADTADLDALRTQGLSRGTAFAVRYAGYAALIVSAVLAGLLGSAIATSVIGPPGPLFTDGWAVLAPPGGPRPVVLLVSGALALGVLALAWWAMIARTGRRDSR